MKKLSKSCHRTDNLLYETCISLCKQLDTSVVLNHSLRFLLKNYMHNSGWYFHMKTCSYTHKHTHTHIYIYKYIYIYIYTYIYIYIYIYIYMARVRQVSPCMQNFFSSFLLVSDSLSPIKKMRDLENIYCFWPSAYKDTTIKWSLRHVYPFLSRRRGAARWPWSRDWLPRAAPD